MSATYNRPRRPAMLDPLRAENIESEYNIERQSELAHLTARALLGQEDENEKEQAAKIRAYAQENGPDALVELWKDMPIDTLPGILWVFHRFLQQYWSEGSYIVNDKGERETKKQVHEGGVMCAPHVPGHDMAYRYIEALLSGRCLVLPEEEAEKILCAQRFFSECPHETDCRESFQKEQWAHRDMPMTFRDICYTVAESSHFLNAPGLRGFGKKIGPNRTQWDRVTLIKP